MKYTTKLLSLLIVLLSGITVQAQYQNFSTNSVVWRANSANISTSISTNDNEVCLSSPPPQSKVTFTATGGTAPYTFTYSVNGANKLKITTTGTSNSATIDVNISTAGTIIYTLDSVASSLESAEAVSGKQVSIKVNDLPSALFTFSNDNECSGTDIVFTPTATPLTAYTFYWDFGDGSTSTQSTPSHKFYSSGTGTQNFNVKLTITNKATGCIGNSNQNVIVKRGSDVSITSDASLVDFNGYKTFTKCENTSQELTFYNASTTLGINMNYAIEWGDGSANFSAASWNTLTHTYNPGLWNLKYSITSQSGCIVTFTYKVFVGSNPSVSLGNPGNTDVCNASPLTFPITGTDNNPSGTTYTVSFNDGSAPVIFNHPPPNEVTHSFIKSSCGITSSNGTISFPNSFSATIIAANPCGTSSVGVVPIYVSTPPIAKFSTSKTVECINKQICLSNLNTIATQAGTSGCSDPKLIWSITPNSGFSLLSGSLGNDFNSSNYNVWLSGSDDICPIFTQPGQYIIKMRIANKCGIDEMTDTICIEPTPIPAFTLDKTEGCAPLTVQTTNTTDETNSCGNGMIYQWEISYTASNCGTTKSYTMTSTNGTITNGISTTKNTTINFINPGTYQLKLTATNSCGGVTSSNQTVVVKVPPVVSIANIANPCQNLTITTISPTATVSSCSSSTLSYEWSFPGGTPSTSSNLVPGTITYAAAGNYTISLKVTNDCSSTTTSKTFTINPQPDVNSITNQEKCVGLMSEAITFSGNIANTTFNWTNSNTNIGLGVSGTGNIPAFELKNTGSTTITSTITVTPIIAATGCTGPIKTFTISVKPALNATIAGSTNTCLNSTSPEITFTGQSGTPPYTFSYQLNGGATQTVTSAANSSTASVLVPTTTKGAYVYTLINVSDGSLASCTRTITGTATVNVTELPNITESLTDTVCSAIPFTVEPVNTVNNNVPAGTTYTWTTPVITPNGALTGGSSQNTDQNKISQTLTNITDSPATATYTVTPKTGSCPGNSFSLVVTVNPTPKLSFSEPDQFICSGNKSKEVQLSSVTTGSINYSWTAAIPAGITGAITSGSDKIPEQTLQNTTNSALTIIYTAKAILNNGDKCSSNDYAYKITVYPTTSVNPINNILLCNKENSQAINFTSNVINTTFEWTNDNPAINLPASGNGPLPTFTATNNGLTDLIAHITVKPKANNCEGLSMTFSITVHPTVSADQPANQTVCNGYKTEEIKFTGNISGAIFNWAHNKPGIGIAESGTGDIAPFQAINTGSTPLIVTFTVTPQINGCDGEPRNFDVIINPSPLFTSQPISESLCIGGTPAKLSVAYKNATSTPTYQWYENSVKDSLSGNPLAGETNDNYQPTGNAIGTKYYYCVLTFPTGGCSNLSSAIATVTINAKPVIDEQPLSTQQVCIGATIAALRISYIGGAGNPTYQWYSNSGNSNSGGTPIAGATFATFNPDEFLSKGTYYYYVIVSFNAGGCGSLTSETAEVIAIDDPVINSQPLSSQTICQGSSPTDLSVVASGGIGAYTYQWYESTPTGTIIINNAIQSTFSPPTDLVSTRMYFCMIGQTGLGCNITSATSTVIVNKAPTFTTQPQSAVYCKDETPVALSVAYIDGAGSPQYQWYINNQNSYLGATALQNETNNNYTPVTTNADIIYYFCIITLPVGGCSGLTSNIAEVTVNQYPVISDYEKEIGSGTNFTVQPLPVSGKDIVPTGTTYTWSTPIISPAGAVTGASAQTTPQTEISQLLTNTTKSIATLTYNVLPVADNCPGQEFKITVKVNAPINANATVNAISCFGTNDGSISTNVEGGKPPYDISWAGADNFSSSLPTISSLKPGDYALTITDEGGLPFIMTYTIVEPAELKITTLEAKNISCYGAANGEINISVSGGNEPYDISWKKDNNFFSNSEDLNNLLPGVYNVTVNDRNNCGPITQTYTITEPEPLKIVLTGKVDNLCAGDKNGSLSVAVSGGTKIETSPGVFDYQYNWIGPKGFTSFSENIDNLYSGKYRLSATDKSGCNTDFEVEVDEPDSITINYTSTPITCYGADDASITLLVSGGIKPYTGKWSNLATGLAQQNLSAGDYTIVVTDSNQCQKSITINVPEAPMFKITPVVKQISCFGAHDGSIKLNIVGGQGNVSLKWSDNSTAGNERNNIGPGIYTVTLTDDKPCYITRSFIIQEPQELKISGKTKNAFDCDNTNSGAIDLEVTGGTMPYNFVWSNGMLTEDLTNIPPGNYFVEITDARACIQSATFGITRQLPIGIEVETAYSYDCTNKKLTQICNAKVRGGIPPYKLTWSSGNLSGTNNELMETDQTASIILTVEDALGCNKSYMFNTNVPNTGINTQLLDCNNHTYQFNFDMPDKILTNVSYAWDFGDGATSAIRNPTHTYMNYGTYPLSVKVTSTECSSTYNQLIVVDSLPVLRLDKPAKLCKNDSVKLFVTGADFYEWSDGSKGDSIVIKLAGDYQVTGTTKNGCTAVLNFSTTYYDNVNYSIITDKDDITPEDPTVKFWSQDVSLSKYLWNFGDGNTDYGNYIYHTYDVNRGGYIEVLLTATNPNGCIETATKKIWMSLSAMPNTFTPNGDGNNDVFLKGWNLQVYNSNGVLIYEGTDGWNGTYNGKPVSSDTYYYVVVIYTPKGSETKANFVTIVR